MMTQKYYIHSLRISHAYMVCFDHIHAPSSTSNSPWTHIFFCFWILQTPLPPNILTPMPRFFKKSHGVQLVLPTLPMWVGPAMERSDTPVTPKRNGFHTHSSFNCPQLLHQGWAFLSPCLSPAGIWGAVTDFSPYWSCACNYSSSMSLTARSCPEDSRDNLNRTQDSKNSAVQKCRA